jgi:SAM-dependent methyltransferase
LASQRLSAIFDPAYASERQWRQAIENLAGQPGVLFDLGGGSPFQGYVKRADLGPDTHYYCLDIYAPACPHLIGDLGALPLAAQSVDAILCNAVLEHVCNPQAAIAEMFRVLRPGGQAMVGVPFIYPFHDRADYFRFSDQALESLFSQFDRVEIAPVGDYFFSALMFLTGFSNRLALWLSPLLHPVRWGFRLAVWLYNRVVAPNQRRDYLRSLKRSPVGWYVYCQKA